MYDEKLNASNFDKLYKPYILPHYQPHLIKVPLALFIGERDTIPNSDSLLEQVPKTTFVHREPEYEHLDFIWAGNAKEKVWPKVLNLLKEYNS
jgi:lysosomal acid lipase/cholesteryl ester hydrolase